MACQFAQLLVLPCIHDVCICVHVSVITAAALTLAHTLCTRTLTALPPHAHQVLQKWGLLLASALLSEESIRQRALPQQLIQPLVTGAVETVQLLEGLGALATAILARWVWLACIASCVWLRFSCVSAREAVTLQQGLSALATAILARLVRLACGWRAMRVVCVCAFVCIRLARQ